MYKSKVSIVRCKNYDADLLLKSVRKSIEFLGGFESFLKPTNRVLLKPNILSDRPPEEAVTTHPEFIRAVIKLLKEYGIKDISVGDSPSGIFKDIDEVYEKSGIKQIADDEKIRLVKFDKASCVEDLLIADEILGADVIINLPKAKTHVHTVITGAIKNMYGSVVGFSKVRYHLENCHIRDFVDMLVNVCRISRPVISIMDAVVSMEGNGPANGPTRKAGLIIASKDPVSLDTVFARIIGLLPKQVLLLNRAEVKKLGIARSNDIEILGEDINSCVIPDYVLPNTAITKVPVFLMKFLASMIKFSPLVNSVVCRKCCRCVEVCPVKAIAPISDKICIDDKKCIRCFCCQEICPFNAIDVKRTLVAKILSKDWTIKKDKKK